MVWLKLTTVIARAQKSMNGFMIRDFDS